MTYSLVYLNRAESQHYVDGIIWIGLLYRHSTLTQQQIGAEFDWIIRPS